LVGFFNGARQFEQVDHVMSPGIDEALYSHLRLGFQSFMPISKTGHVKQHLVVYTATLMSLPAPPRPPGGAYFSITPCLHRQ
jgi:hypothetical protein